MANIKSLVVLKMIKIECILVMVLEKFFIMVLQTIGIAQHFPVQIFLYIAAFRLYSFF